MADAGGGAVQSRQLRLRRRQYEVLRRRADALQGGGFRPRSHMGGESPGWPMTYSEIEPWYQKAETLYRVRGSLGQDPTEPEHSGTIPFPPVPDEPEIADLRRRLESRRIAPRIIAARRRSRGVAGAREDALGRLPRYHRRQDGCRKRRAGRGAETSERRTRTGVTAERLETDGSGRVVALLTSAGRIEADQVVLAAGAVHTPVLLLGRRPRPVRAVWRTGRTRSGATS
jgi:choline dehydrogenase-like flavoprotein